MPAPPTEQPTPAGQPVTTPPATNATTTTTPLDALPDCPVTALDGGRRAGRDHVLARAQRRQRGGDPARHRRLQRQPGPGPRLAPRTRAATSRRSTSSSSRPWTTGPAIVMFPDYSDAAGDRLGQAVIPTQACTEAARIRHVAVPAVDDRRLQRRRRAMGDAVQRLEPGPLLQPQHVRGGRPRPEPSASVAGGAAPVLAAARRLGCRHLRHRPRFGQRFGRRVVHRAVVRQHGRALRRQRQRAAGAGDEGAVRRRRRRAAADLRAVARERECHAGESVSIRWSASAATPAAATRPARRRCPRR